MCMHYFDVVAVAGAVDVRVVTGFGRILDDAGVDGDAALLLFGRVVDLVVRDELGELVLGEHARDGRRQRRLSVVHVPDRADVQMRLVAHEHPLHARTRRRRRRQPAGPLRLQLGPCGCRAAAAWIWRPQNDG